MQGAPHGLALQSQRLGGHRPIFIVFIRFRFCFRFIVYTFPAVVHVDRSLLGRTLIERDGAEFGKHPTLASFVGNQVSVRRADGSLVTAMVSPYPGTLHRYAASNRWAEATRLCRFAKEDTLWACLAGMAANARDLDTAEAAYSAIAEADKVHYIQYIKGMPLREARNAEMAAFTGNYADAETILLQAGLVFRAILLNIHLHQWEKALDLGLRHRVHVDTVLAYRLKHLNRFDMEETIDKFNVHGKEVEIDWEQIAQKIELELDRERSGRSSGP